MTKQIPAIIFLLFILTHVVKAQNNYNEISLPELMKKKQADKNIVVVDVRTNAEYYDSATRGKQSNIGRIKDALHIELRDLQQNPDAVKQLDAYKDKDIYLICSHSYRSRSASSILLKNGFTHVNNVRGGMTEWFRRYDDLAPYKSDFYETSTSYENVSPSQVAHDLIAGKNPLLIGISGTPRFWWDSATKKLYDYLPLFKEAIYFDYSDSLKVLETVQKEKGRQVVFFNMVNNGAAELADWLTQKGIPGISYLVGGNYYFYEHIRNKQLAGKAGKFMVQKNSIQFITPIDYCNQVSQKNLQVIDLRHDTLFNKISDGVKYDYRYLKGSVNFFAGKGEDLFSKEFPDKQKNYILMSQDGMAGLELAGALTKKGYKIYWLMGGLWRLEWYTINIEDFGCKDILVK
ncbi:MAG: rhodanese-like domain-containing protein [Bacteroidota bacterium]|nr:rhodanese-like domain-containing protein [Bacteroidota bacterium]